LGAFNLKLIPFGKGTFCTPENSVLNYRNGSKTGADTGGEAAGPLHPPEISDSLENLVQNRKKYIS